MVSLSHNMGKSARIAIVLLLFVSLLYMGCAKKKQEDDRVLAKVSNRLVTLNEFKERISKLPSYYRDIANRNKKRFLDEMIVEMLFYEEAIRNGLDRDREVKEIIMEAKKKILIAKLVKTEVEDKIQISDSEIKEFYEGHKADFKAPELWRASHILVATEDEAKGILDELSKGASFEDLAKAHSIDATADRGGDVGYFRLGQIIPDFENACLKLQVGQTSGIVHTQFGYHIIKLTDKKEPAVQPLEKVRRAIEDELRKKKRSELFDKLVLKLKKRYQVTIEEDVFKSLETLNGKKEAVKK